MRRMATLVMIGIFSASLALAQTYNIQSDKNAQANDRTQEERNLEILSKKLVRMKKEMDKFVKDMSATYQTQVDPAIAAYGSDVKVDMIENDKDFVVTADLPGMDKDKIVVTLDNNKVLKISGSREATKTQAGPNVVKQERMEGKFERVVELPAECKSDGIKASYKNGVLEITIPKKEPAKKETIKVSVQ